MLKSFCVNLGSIFIFFLLSFFFVEEPQELRNLLIFEIILLWICNEIWYWVFSSTFMLYALVYRAKNKREANKNTIKLFYHASSLVLLILPLLLYAILYLADQFTNTGMQTFLGVSFSRTTLLCSYVGIMITWLISLFQTFTPFALENIFLKTFSPELFLESASETKVSSDELIHPRLQSGDLLSHHKSLLKDSLTGDETILYTGRPVIAVNNKYAKRDFMIGCFSLPFTTIMLIISMKLFLEDKSDFTYIITSSMSGILTIIFGYVTYCFLMSPFHWKRKLSKVSYAITNKRIFIFENKSQQYYYFTDKLNIVYEALIRDIGNIYLSKEGKISSIINNIFGKNTAQVVDNKNSISLSVPLAHLFQVQDAKKVLALIKEYQQKNCMNAEYLTK